LTRDTIIITAARGWIGTPYAHQASVKGVGCDCLGLIRGVWRDVIGKEPEAMPAYSPDWAEAGGKETMAEAASRHMKPITLKDMQPGDLLLFRWRRHLPAKHAGLLTSAESFIHAQDGACVCEAPLSPWWRRRIAYVFRFPG
jgi:NlpC/P60 family putative phage cell wall peptidase